jgi:hypothetical protein
MSALFAFLVVGSAATADIRPLLREQGFDGPINGRETVKYAGHIRQGRNDYQIYTYFGIHRAAVVDHGRSDIIVILNGSMFFGSYNTGWPTDCTVRGQRVICNTRDPRCPGVIEFTKRGPPAQIWFDCANPTFAFGNKVRAARQ